MPETSSGNGRGALFVDADEFNASVAVARLAIDLAYMQGQNGSPEEFLNEAMDLICQAHNVIFERKL
jgi:hypothetical protein